MNEIIVINCVNTANIIFALSFPWYSITNRPFWVLFHSQHETPIVCTDKEMLLWRLRCFIPTYLSHKMTHTHQAVSWAVHCPWILVCAVRNKVSLRRRRKRVRWRISSLGRKWAWSQAQLARSFDSPRPSLFLLICGLGKTQPLGSSATSVPLTLFVHRKYIWIALGSKPSIYGEKLVWWELEQLMLLYCS